MKLNIVPYEQAEFEGERWAEGTVVIDEISIKYLQNTDSSGDDGNEDVQELTLTARNNGVVRFVNIKTKSWSIDDIDELEKIFKDFKKRAGIKDVR